MALCISMCWKHFAAAKLKTLLVQKSLYYILKVNSEFYLEIDVGIYYQINCRKLVNNKEKK